MKKYTAILLLLFPAIFSSCDNELHVNASYKETIVVYGLLDYTQEQQYIKINKAFLSKDNSAYIDAQNSDSLYLDSIEAKLIDNIGNEFPLTKVSIPNKKDGIFSNDVNFLYTTSAKISPANSYHLEVKNPITENTVTSYTQIVRNAIILSPVNSNQVKWYIKPDGNIKFQFVSGLNAILYDAKVQFTYEEIQKSDTNIRDTHTIDWFVLKNRVLDNAKGGNYVTINVESNLFYDFIGTKIKENDAVWRKAISGAFVVYGGGEEINTYISVSKPSIGIVQKVQDYSNINNGKGVFSSRNVHAIKDIQFSPLTLSSLRFGSSTKALNFIN